MWVDTQISFEWLYCLSVYSLYRDVTRTLIGEGGVVVYIHIYISFQIDQFEFDLKRNLSGRT